MTGVVRGAYTDEKGIRWDTNGSDFEGELTKRSEWLGAWRKRYMILKGSKLFFATSPTAAPHGMIDLVDCEDVGSHNQGSDTFLIRCKSRDWPLRASTIHQRDAWIHVIEKAIQKHSSICAMRTTDESHEPKTTS
jgi:hypothetical protein